MPYSIVVIEVMENSYIFIGYQGFTMCSPIWDNKYSQKREHRHNQGVEKLWDNSSCSVLHIYYIKNISGIKRGIYYLK